MGNVSDKFVNLLLEDQSLKFVLRKRDVYSKDRKSLDVERVHSCFRNAMCLIHFLGCILAAWVFLGLGFFQQLGGHKLYLDIVYYFLSYQCIYAYIKSEYTSDSERHVNHWEDVQRRLVSPKICPHSILDAMRMEPECKI